MSTFIPNVEEVVSTLRYFLPQAYSGAEPGPVGRFCALLWLPFPSGGLSRAAGVCTAQGRAQHRERQKFQGLPREQPSGNAEQAWHNPSSPALQPDLLRCGLKCLSKGWHQLLQVVTAFFMFFYWFSPYHCLTSSQGLWDHFPCESLPMFSS